MKYYILDLEQTIIQKSAYYHSEEGYGDLTPMIEEARDFSLEEINTIKELYPEDKFAIIPVKEFNNIVTIEEAADILSKDVTFLIDILKCDKFIENIDYRKSGKTILVDKNSLNQYFEFTKHE